MAKTILIVDENVQTKKIKEGVFKFCDFAVKSASNAKEAFELAKEGGIDVVLSDNPMFEELNSEEFVVSMKGNCVTKNIPIVMISAINGKFERMKMQDRGVSEFVVSPFNVSDLIKKVKALSKVNVVYSNN